MPEWSVGHIDSSGADTVNNLWVRTGFIDLSEVDFDYIYKSVATTVYLFEYGSDQSFIRRDTLNVSGRNVITLNSNAAYIRIATPKTVDTRIVVKPPYAQKRDVSVLMRGADNISLKCVHHDNFSRTMTG